MLGALDATPSLGSDVPTPAGSAATGSSLASICQAQKGFFKNKSSKGTRAKYTATKENTDVLASCLEPFDTYKEE